MVEWTGQFYKPETKHNVCLVSGGKGVLRKRHGLLPTLMWGLAAPYDGNEWTSAELLILYTGLKSRIEIFDWVWSHGFGNVHFGYWSYLLTLITM